MSKRVVGVSMGAAAFVLLAVPAAGIAASSPSSASAPKPQKIVIAASWGYKALMQAQRTGVFKKAGLRAVILPTDPKGVVKDVVGGTAQLGITDAGVAMYLSTKDTASGLQIVAGAEADAGKAYGVFGGSGITDIGSLYQQKIGIAGGIGSIPQLATSVWLDNNGADSTSIVWRSMVTARLAGALSSGTVNAAFGATGALKGKSLGDPVIDAFGAGAPTNVVLAKSGTSAALLKKVIAALGKVPGFTTKLNMDGLGQEASTLLNYAYVDSAPDLDTLVWSGAPKS